MSRKEQQSRRSHGEPSRPSPLPEQLADFLKNRAFACLMHGTDKGTVFVVKVPSRDIKSARGRVPIHLRHELYQHPSAPVVRTVIRIYDQPDLPLALETFTNVQDEAQRAEFAALAVQKSVLLLFYDEGLKHRLTKQVDSAPNDAIPEIVRQADELLARIPPGQFDFDRAKAAVVRRTRL